jgi:hypothetical protein
MEGPSKWTRRALVGALLAAGALAGGIMASASAGGTGCSTRPDGIRRCSDRHGRSVRVASRLRTASLDPSIYWGAEIGPQFTGEEAPWDMGAVRAFARLTAKKPSIVAFNIPLVGCGTPTFRS